MHHGRGVKAWHGAARVMGGGRQALLHRDASYPRVTASSVTAVGGAGVHVPRMRASENNSTRRRQRVPVSGAGLESSREAGTTFKEQHSSCSACALITEIAPLRDNLLPFTHSILHPVDATAVANEATATRCSTRRAATGRVSAGEPPPLERRRRRARGSYHSGT